MGALQLNPNDQNLLQGSKFSLSFVRLPYIQFFLQEVNIPGITTNPTQQPTPFIDAPVPADKMVYERLDMTFLLDEPLWAWTSVNDWLKGLTFPESFDQYKNLTLQQRLQTQNAKPQYSDAILTVFTNKNNPIIQLNFIDVFPVTLSSITLSTKAPATDVLTASASFAFTNYTIQRQM
jgi:hypothetical protein